MGGWNIQPLLAWWTGATVVLERTFDAGRVLQLIDERRITTMMGVPAQLPLARRAPGFAAADLSSLQHAIVGGAPMPDRCCGPGTRGACALTQGYGLTEASPNVLCLPDEDARIHVGYAGKPYPHVEVAVADPATGEILDRRGHRRAAGARARRLRRLLPRSGGHGARRSPAAGCAPATWWNATATASTGSWTGSRTCTSPAARTWRRREVEQALLAHPAVAEAAVVGVPDERWGETGLAYVVVRPGQITDDEELAEHCKAQLACFKVPGAF